MTNLPACRPQSEKQPVRGKYRHVWWQVHALPIGQISWLRVGWNFQFKENMRSVMTRHEQGKLRWRWGKGSCEVRYELWKPVRRKKHEPTSLQEPERFFFTRKCVRQRIIERMRSHLSIKVQFLRLAQRRGLSMAGVPHELPGLRGEMKTRLPQ